MSSTDDTTTAPAPARFALPGTIVALGVVLWLVLGEISALSGQFVVADSGATASFDQHGGPMAWAYADHWRDALSQRQLGDWRALLLIYLLVDLAFIGVLTVGLWRLVTRVGGSTSWVLRLVAALAVVDVAEDLAWWVVGGWARDAADRRLAFWESGLLIGPTLLKWVLVAALLVVGLRALARSAGTRHRLRQLSSAVFLQRFSLLAFLPLAALTVLPLGQLNNLFDQLPDVQRAWLESGDGRWHAFFAALVFGGGVLPGIYLLGLLRSTWAARREGSSWPSLDRSGSARKQPLLFWAIGPVVLLLAALLVTLVLDGEVFARRLVIFCLVPAVVVLVSQWLRAQGRPGAPEPLPGRAAPYAADVRAVGEVLTLAAVSLTGLGLVRAFAQETALDRIGLLDLGPVRPWPHPLVALAIGALVAVLPWVLSRQLLAALEWLADRVGIAGRIEGRIQERPSTGRLPEGTVSAIMLAGSIGVFLFLAAQPRFVAYEVFGTGLGVLGVATLALSTLILMLGLLVAHAQSWPPPEVFQVLPLVPRPQSAWRRLTKQPADGDDRWWRPWRATPVVTLLLVATVASAALGDRTDVHPVARESGIPDRPTVQEAFTSWEAAPGGCRVAGPAGFTVRPMVMYAAEGGGIRAAYWTAAALDVVGAAGDGCGRRSALLSGGASGGAVGLTLARFAGDGSARDLAATISGPEALAVASVSLAAGDLLASAAGIRFAEDRGGDRELLDRAGLMEAAWLERSSLDDDFVPAEPALDAATGQLVLTTTAARDGCRALLSQVDLSAGAREGADWPTCGGGDAGPDSWDVLAEYGGPGDAGDTCLGNPRALTAGLLAGRFPYVTPSGVIGGCDGLDPTQLIDGGYSDNTGLGTLLGLAPSWGAEVRTHNDRVLAAGSGDLVVPLVVFLDNGSGSDYTVTTRTTAAEQEAEVAPSAGGRWWPGGWSIPEALVPLIGAHHAGAHRVRANEALARAQEEVRSALCTPPAPDAVSAAADAELSCLDLLGSRLGARPVFVVHQARQPSIAAPLGWSLSEASRADLDADLEVQCRGEGVRAGGYGSLHDLVRGLAGPFDEDRLCAAGALSPPR